MQSSKLSFNYTIDHLEYIYIVHSFKQFKRPSSIIRAFLGKLKTFNFKIIGAGNLFEVPQQSNKGSSHMYSNFVFEAG